MMRAIKRILMGLTLLAGALILMYGLGLVSYHSATWFADSVVDSVAYEQDSRGEQARERVAFRSAQNFIRE